MRNLLVLLLIPLGAYAALCALLFATQRSQIYFRVPEVQRPGAEAIRLPSGDDTLKVWVLRRPGPRALIYFGGNAEDVSLNLPSFAAAFPAHTLYLVNYRGYAGSTGRPSEKALLADAEAVYDRVSGQHDAISVVGRSLGSGVAVHLASVRAVERLALVSPYESLVAVAREHYRWLPVGLLMLDRFDSSAKAAAVRAPVLVIIAAQDEIIPPRRSHALHQAFASGQARLVEIAGATHNSLDAFPRYLASLSEFLVE